MKKPYAVRAVMKGIDPTRRMEVSPVWLCEELTRVYFAGMRAMLRLLRVWLSEIDAKWWLQEIKSMEKDATVAKTVAIEPNGKESGNNEKAVN